MDVPLRNSPVYSPPCWVNPDLQQILLSSERQNIYVVAKQLWEASGGEECGFVEFQKYLEHTKIWLPRAMLCTVWHTAGRLLLSDREGVLGTPKKQLSPFAPVFQRRCVYCETSDIEIQSDKYVCSNCEHATKIVKSVIMNVLN